MSPIMTLLCPSLIGSLFADYSFVQFATQQTLQRDSAPMIWIFLSLALFIIAISVFISGKYSKNFRWFLKKLQQSRRQAPWLYSKILNLGKGEQLLQIYEKIKEEGKV